MGKAYIFNRHLTPDERATIEAAVSHAGFDPIYDIPDDLSAVDPDQDIGVFGIPFLPEDEAGVKDKIRKFGGEGIRVIAIWLRKNVEAGVGIPEDQEKYGSATVCADAEDITDALQGKASPWQNPDGSPRLPKATKRNRC